MEHRISTSVVIREETEEVFHKKNDYQSSSILPTTNHIWFSNVREYVWFQ